MDSDHRRSIEHGDGDRRDRGRGATSLVPGARCVVVSREMRFAGVGKSVCIHSVGGWGRKGTRWRGRRSWCAIVRFRRMCGNPTMGPHSFRLPRNWNQRARGPTTGHRPRGIAHRFRVDP